MTVAKQAEGYRFDVRTFHAQYAESNVKPIPRKHPLEQSKDPLHSVSRPQAALDVQGLAQALFALRASQALRYSREWKVRSKADPFKEILLGNHSPPR